MAADHLDWRESTIALAALGAMSLSKTVFARGYTGGLGSAQMQVPACLALGDSIVVERPDRTSLEWLTSALEVDYEPVERTLLELERRGLIREGRFDARALREELDLAGWEDVAIEDEIPYELTPAGVDAVRSWLARIRPRFGNWPPDRPDVDDVTG